MLHEDMAMSHRHEHHRLWSRRHAGYYSELVQHRRPSLLRNSGWRRLHSTTTSKWLQCARALFVAWFRTVVFDFKGHSRLASCCHFYPKRGLGADRVLLFPAPCILCLVPVLGPFVQSNILPLMGVLFGLCVVSGATAPV